MYSGSFDHLCAYRGGREAPRCHCPGKAWRAEARASKDQDAVTEVGCEIAKKAAKIWWKKGKGRWTTVFLLNSTFNGPAGAISSHYYSRIANMDPPLESPSYAVAP
jgi:hypothetical protein